MVCLQLKNISKTEIAFAVCKRHTAILDRQILSETVAKMLCHARKRSCTNKYVHICEYIEMHELVCELHALKCVYRILAHHACCDALRMCL
jgi:hypothetical protein